MRGVPIGTGMLKRARLPCTIDNHLLLGLELRRLLRCLGFMPWWSGQLCVRQRSGLVRCVLSLADLFRRGLPVILAGRGARVREAAAFRCAEQLK